MRGRRMRAFMALDPISHVPITGTVARRVSVFRSTQPSAEAESDQRTTAR
jgi:hypothetical protein